MPDGKFADVQPHRTSPIAPACPGGAPVVKAIPSSAALCAHSHSWITVPTTSWIRTCVPSRVNCCGTGGAVKLETLQVSASDGANVWGRHTPLIGFLNQACWVPIRSPCGVIRNT